MFHKKRPKERTFLYGRQPLAEALREGKNIDKILLKSNISGEGVQEVLQLAKQQQVIVQRVPVEKLNALTDKNHQGMLAFLSPIQVFRLEDILSQVYEAGEMPLFLLLDGITDVRNFGAIARSALCFGAHAIVLSERNSPAINEDALKTSAGALLQLPVCREKSLRDAIMLLQKNGVLVAASTLAAAEPLHHLDLSVPMALILGAEDSGVQETHLKIADYLVKIPIAPHFDSLNVGVAAGVMLYECARQRGFGGI